MKAYKKIDIEIIKFEDTDVIVTSNEGVTPGEEPITTNP